MIPFYSRRNQVYAALWNGRAAVEKHFTHDADWRRESGCYAALSGHVPIPRVLASRPGLLITEYCPRPTLLAVLEEQERTGSSPEPWRALAEWLIQCHRQCGMLPVDGSLRNFLWDARLGVVIGLDLEGYQPRSLPSCGAELAAMILAYSPEDTPAKRRAAGLVSAALEVPDRAVTDARRRLMSRRRGQAGEKYSGIVLAGGLSRRMGRNKAELPLLGRTFLQWQVEKLQSLGIHDIMISGPDGLTHPAARTVPDVFPGRGPLGGLHACLSAACASRCLVVSVDAPLVPASALAHLCRAHRDGGTVLEHGDRQEPLLAVYDSGAARSIEGSIGRESAPVRSLKEQISWTCFKYLGPEELLLNCNTPEDLGRLTALAEAYRACGLPL